MLLVSRAMAHHVSAPASSEASAAPAFQPYVPASQAPAEFTLKAVIIGVLFGLLFGASTVYLGLRAGLTVSASIPIAVLAISVLKRLGGSTILENNIVQTIGSAGESIASGVVFTLPALLFLLPNGPAYFAYLQITLCAFAGGVLGVLMMVPLRRALIVKEHGALPYPEGTACADVLVAGEQGGNMAKAVFMGLGVGAAWKGLSWIVQLTRTAIGYTMARGSFFPNATLNVDISPEYMGVGYVIGPRIAGVMFAGGVLSWLVLLPLFTMMGEFMTAPFPPIPASGKMLSAMTAGEIWRAYIRYTGAGAVLASGIITLARTLPTIVSSFRDSVKDLRGGSGAAAAQIRTEQDTPMLIVVGGTLALALFLLAMPKLPTYGNVLATLLIIVFGFFFVTVSSRITGPDRQLVEPDLGHDHRDADPDLHDLRRAGLDRRRLRADRALGRRHGVHRGGQRRRDVAGPEDRLPRRRHATSPADRPDDRGDDVVAGHRPDHALPAPDDADRLAGAAGAAGDADGDADQGAARAGPAVGPGPRRRVHHHHARALRHPQPLVRGRLLPAHLDDGARSSPAASCARWWSARPARPPNPRSAPARSSAPGLIAGGSLAGILYAILYGRGFIQDAEDSLGLSTFLHEGASGQIVGVVVFLLLGVVLWQVGRRKID